MLSFLCIIQKVYLFHLFYYLTEAFASSVLIYAQNPNGFKSLYTKAKTDAPLPFSVFKYSLGFWPEALVACVFKARWLTQSEPDYDFGGHFSSLDNPPALLGDLREIASYWETKD